MRKVGNSYFGEPRLPRSRGFGFSPFRLVGGFFIFILLLFLVGGGIYVWAIKNSERVVTFTVQDKESVTVSSGSGDSLEVHNEYRVYTDQGTFKVTDTLIYGRFNAADVYGRLKQDHTYACKIAGWRFGLFSWFPNIIECNEVKAQEQAGVEDN